MPLATNLSLSHFWVTAARNSMESGCSKYQKHL